MHRLVVISLVFLSSLYSAAPVNAESLQQVKQSLINDISAAQQHLSRLEKSIAQQSQSMAKQIRDKQQQVIQLRDQAAVKRRLLDDQTLALSDIQARLNKWQQQDNFQKRLLLEVAEKQNASTELLNQISQDLAAGLPLLSQQLDKQTDSFAPTWQHESILLADGKFSQADTIQLGPIKWFLQADNDAAGLLNQQNEVQFFFDADQTEQLRALYTQSQGQLSFDPTLGNAIKLEKSKETPWQHVQRGGIWVIPIIAFGLFALLIAAYKAWQLLRLPKLQPLLTERIEMLNSSSDADVQLAKLATQMQGAQKHLLNITLTTPHGEQRDDRLLAFLLEYRQKLQANLGAVAITASVAPLLGLLGTVSGMIETFNMMNLFGSGDPAVVSGGISKALITTELGLVVAIPALVIHALLNRYIRNHHTQLDNTAIRLGKLPSTSAQHTVVEAQAA